MKIISTAEAARRLGVTPNRVRMLIEAKRLKATKLGNVWVINPKDLDAVTKRKPGRPRKRSRWLLADKGYDAEHLRHYCDRYRMQPVIPLRAMPRKPRPGLPRLFDRPMYRQRYIIERMFGWLKENRRIGTRYDKLAKSFAAMVTLTCSLRCMRQYFSYKT